MILSSESAVLQLSSMAGITPHLTDFPNYFVQNLSPFMPTGTQERC